MRMVCVVFVYCSSVEGWFFVYPSFCEELL